MKKTFKIISYCICFTILLNLQSCSYKEPGVTYSKLNGDEQNLPNELKGLKIYNVSLGSGEYVNVAVMNDEINSSTYKAGKSQYTTIIVDNNKNDKIKKVKEILMENDSMIMFRK